MGSFTDHCCKCGCVLYYEYEDTDQDRGKIKIERICFDCMKKVEIFFKI